MSQSIQLLTSPASGASNYQLATVRPRLQNISWNEHGPEQASIFIPCDEREQFYWLTRQSVPHGIVSEGAWPVWVGRGVGVKQVRGGVVITARGYWDALNDEVYTALWSCTRTDAWRPVATHELSTAADQKFEFNNTNQLFIGLKKNETYTQNTHAGWYALRTPNNGSRYMATLAFDYEMLATSAVYRFRVATYTSETYGGGAVINDLNATGATLSGALCFPLSGNVVLAIMGLYNYNSATHNYTGETGAHYLKLTNVRVTTNALAVNTTLSANAAGGATSISVASTAGMVVGRELYLGGANPEKVTITSIGGTVGITALANAKVIGDTARMQAVYADEIVRDLITLNSAQLNSATVLVESPGLDLKDEVYEDEAPANIVNKLVGLGDSQTPPRQWEAGVDVNRVLFFRPQSTASRTWYIEVENPEFDKQLGPLRNAYYAKYREAGGRTLRTARNTDANSVSRWGVTRAGVVDTQSTNSTEAGVYRDAALNDNKDPKPKANVRVKALFDVNGNRWPFMAARPGDTFVMRGLGINQLSSQTDRFRSFRATRVEVSGGELTVEPEEPPETLEVLVARALEGF